ncbi:MAG: ABC transporter substrate-binding protein [Rhodospirillales bacterium]|nr:ABC transporter substrate-binding protein [Rhodospirillales bacterium]
MTSRLLRSLVVFVFLIGSTVFAAPARATGVETEAQKFIEDMAQEAVRSLTDPAVPRPQRVNNFRSLFRSHFAVEEIGKWILARHWNLATEEERQEYLALLVDLLVVSYVDRFAGYAGEKLKVLRVLADTPERVSVFSEMTRPQSEDLVHVNWVVSKKFGPFKVVDVVVEGTSMGQTLRSDYGSIIRQKDGKIAALLAVMREKTAELRQASN